MSGIERLMTAMRTADVPVFPIVAPFDDEFPDSYIVVTPVASMPDVFAGDNDEHGAEQLRASWYCRQGNTGHAATMRTAAKAAGFIAVSGFQTYDPSTKHYVDHEEFWIESEE